jgi:hypothetical protein
MFAIFRDGTPLHALNLQSESLQSREVKAFKAEREAAAVVF